MSKTYRKNKSDYDDFDDNISTKEARLRARQERRRIRTGDKQSFINSEESYDEDNF